MLFLSYLSDQVRQKSHEAGALDRESEFALVPGADARTLARNDLAEGGQVATQGIGVLVVNFGSIDLAEVASAHFLKLGRLVVHNDEMHDR